MFYFFAHTDHHVPTPDHSYPGKVQKSKPEILAPDGNFFEKFTPALQPYVPNNSALGESVPPNNSPLGTVYLLTIHTVGLYTS